MPRFARQVLVALLALAVIVGGIGRFAADCAGESSAAHAHAAGGSHAGHHHDHPHDAAKKLLAVPGCLKCCGICITDSGLLRGALADVDLRSIPAVFLTASKTYRDRSVVVD